MCFQLSKQIVAITGKCAKLSDGSVVDLSMMTEECLVGDWVFIADKFVVEKVPKKIIEINK